MRPQVGDARGLRMYAKQVTGKRGVKHRIFMSESQERNRKDLLEWLELDETEVEPPDRDKRRAVTIFLSEDEVTQFQYQAQAHGFRGAGSLGVALVRWFNKSYPIPKFGPPGQK